MFISIKNEEAKTLIKIRRLVYIHPFTKYLLGTYHLLATVLGAKTTILNSMDKALPSWNPYLRQKDVLNQIADPTFTLVTIAMETQIPEAIRVYTK